MSYEYNAAGRRTKRRLENNTFTDYGYDDAGQPTSIVHKKNDLTVISSYAYGYDDSGQRTWVKRANGNGDVYKYDATDQLTNVMYEASNPDTTPSGWTNELRYVFDAAGNRSSVVVSNSAGESTTSYTANTLNQYTAVGGVTPTYDGNGNLTYDGTWTYTYDRENRLIQAVNGGTTITYTYDAFNRLIERAVGSSKLRFYYDQQWRVIEERNENDTVLRKYVYGPGIDEPVRFGKGGPQRWYYHEGALGTITETTYVSGNLAEQYRYDVYGTATIYYGGSTYSSSQLGNRFMFQGRDRDPDTGLYNFRNRYYSPSLGRFVQPDPIRQLGGLNLYQFVFNDPVQGTDPHGLLSINSLVKRLAQRMVTALLYRVLAALVANWNASRCAALGPSDCRTCCYGTFGALSATGAAMAGLLYASCVAALSPVVGPFAVAACIPLPGLFLAELLVDLQMRLKDCLAGCPCGS